MDNGTANYYLANTDMWVEETNDGSLISLVCPDLRVHITMPRGKLRTQKLHAMVPMVKHRDHGGAGVVCSAALLPIFRQLADDPELLKKLVAVTEAHIALEGGSE